MFRLVFSLVVVPAMFAVGAAHGADPGRPNVLFLMADDLRPELGCYGAPVQTPNIDALAAAGVRFERAYVQYPLCCPSRSSMLTGRHPDHTGVYDNTTWFGAAHPDWKSLPRYFKDQGYASLRAGKIFHGGIDDYDAWTAGGEPRNFTGGTTVRKVPPNRKQTSDNIVKLEADGQTHNDYKAADLAIKYLEEYAGKDQPFFLACGFTKPHSPPTAPARFFDLYDASKIVLPVDFAAVPAAPAGFPKGSITQNGDLFIEREASPAEAREMIKAYRASTSFTDWNVGRVLAALDRLKLQERTIVVFWGDHGYHLGEKGKWSKHQSLYEIGTRVPLIFDVPGSKVAGVSSPRIVQSVDIYPTLVDLCGLPKQEGLDGVSLRPLLEIPDSAWNRPAYSRAGSAQKYAAAVRTERYRYAEYGPGGSEGAMLFDEQADPNELKNLADDPQFKQIRDELKALLRKL
jgi:arylsulfatase A-like enzyme